MLPGGVTPAQLSPASPSAELAARCCSAPSQAVGTECALGVSNTGTTALADACWLLSRDGLTASTRQQHSASSDPHLLSAIHPHAFILRAAFNHKHFNCSLRAFNPKTTKCSHFPLSQSQAEHDPAPPQHRGSRAPAWGKERFCNTRFWRPCCLPLPRAGLMRHSSDRGQ